MDLQDAVGVQMRGFRERYDLPETDGDTNIIKKGVMIVLRSLVTEEPSACISEGAVPLQAHRPPHVFVHLLASRVTCGR